MKIIDIAAAELTFNIWKFGFYYRPYGDTKWIRLPKCFTWKKRRLWLLNIKFLNILKINKCLVETNNGTYL